MDGLGSILGGGRNSSLFAIQSRPALTHTKHPAQWVQGTLSPGLERPVHEVDISPPPSTEVKNAWS
jgi:hypothetical protein